MDSSTIATMIAIIPTTITAIAAVITIIISTRKVYIVNTRVNLVQIYQTCKDRGYRTSLDTKLFYNVFDVYTKTLKQNSYICEDVEPEFKKLPTEG